MCVDGISNGLILDSLLFLTRESTYIDHELPFSDVLKVPFKLVSGPPTVTAGSPSYHFSNFLYLCC